MYILAVLLVVIFLWVVLTIVAGGFGGFFMMLDFPSLVVLMIISVSMLMAAGLWKDFWNAFRLTMGKKKQAGLAEWKRAKEAVELFMVTLRYGGLFAALIHFVALSAHIQGSKDGLALWWVNMGVLILIPLYAFALNILFLPIRSRLNINIIEYMQGVGDAEEDEGEDKK